MYDTSRIHKSKESRLQRYKYRYMHPLQQEDPKQDDPQVGNAFG